MTAGWRSVNRVPFRLSTDETGATGGTYDSLDGQARATGRAVLHGGDDDARGRRVYASGDAGDRPAELRATGAATGHERLDLHLSRSRRQDGRRPRGVVGLRQR